ncbi:bifunctional UDP-N-acetylglucosamine pyrophosphorylase/glucosamine-1-phosphate N-acetyltransferase [Pullulanibacillus pueri]|uniref:Bifunctional protein GlmU n=1 Tax=Pullulanibacillus pueri TaxID=1437324 RepID=A0A8J3EPE7_9BACL|nr:bifunctional UDP-N-acetylglucosamine diphosphorylase/glucosamine-1-phosphate N-acetyltransferase GlmU [Pullulanibacillus pueri]MBM7684007.1 bifunctional UDP-N-acetylglucosamine pyrophosphorylase/glucosamine-1-phosphate N-acetyltransferase [Pullulanibacillus pueri]GGH88310.1 bifunctional protein GlmU [Pullulanibacillus pueri]
MANRYAVILAAGQGTRMKSKLYKVLHQVCGKPMIQHIVDQIKPLAFEKLVTVVGHGAERVKEQLADSTEYVLQEEQLGTGHAVLQASAILGNLEGTTVVLCGDTPLVTQDTIETLLEYHEKAQSAATVLTAYTDSPKGYGRIIRSVDGALERIVEEKDASSEERSIKEVNSGIFCFDNHKLFSALSKVSNDNAQGEYYLPDVLSILQNEGHSISACQVDAFDELLGVNDRVALARAEKLMQKRINEDLMRKGVTLIDPDHTYISIDVEIGADTVVLPGCKISGTTTIGEDCEIGPHTEIKDSQVGNSTTIKQSVVSDSEVGNGVHIGPFAHIRPLSKIGNDVKVGNFVEIKKSSIGEGTKASHLSYIGDAEVGAKVNLGCGSITVNYDGTHKFLTKIEDGAFIGCNANLVAPVTVGKGAFVAAGSTITDDINANALAIARARQTNKENYVEKLRSKNK